MKRTG